MTLVGIFVTCSTLTTCEDNINKSEENFWVECALDSASITFLIANNSKQLFAATNGGKLYRSGTTQEAWEELNPMIQPGHSITSMVIDQNGIIYAGTYNGLLSKLIVAHDNGENWSIIPIPENWFISDMSITNTNDIVILSQSSDETQSGIFQSVDMGTNWTEINIPTGYPTDVEILSDNTILIGSTEGFAYTSDNGNNWTLSNNGLLDTYIEHVAVGRNNEIYVQTESNGLFRSVDNGESWSQTRLIQPCMSFLHITESNSLIAGFGNYCNEPTGIYMSSDYGDSWVNINSGLPSNDVTCIASLADGDVFVGLRNHGVYRSIELLNE